METRFKTEKIYKRSIMHKKITVFSLGAAFLTLTSCASVLRGSKETFHLSSDPQGARVEILDKTNTVVAKATTPGEVKLKKGAGFFSGQNYTVKVSKEGHKPSSFRIENGLNIGAYVVGNLFLGGFLGMVIVDPASGAMWNLKAANATTDNGTVQTKKKKVTVILEKE